MPEDSASVERQVVAPSVRRTRCGVCGSSEFVVRGSSRHSPEATIAGHPVTLAEDRFEIRECRRCRFRWKSPRLTDAEYVAFCQTSGNKHWHLDGLLVERRRLHEKRRLIESYVSSGRVLDIGCWEGAFLSCWGPQWRKFGVEPSREARHACREAGIALVGRRTEDLAGAGPQFDAVCLMDVVEHLTDPFEQLRPIAERLVEGGVLAIETGDTRSALAAILGVDWHYYAAAEHVSFWRATSLRAIIERLGLRPEGVWRWPHMVFPRRHVLRQWLTALTAKWPFLRPRHLARSLLLHGRWPRKQPPSPWLTGLKDHIFVVAVKPRTSAPTRPSGTAQDAPAAHTGAPKRPTHAEQAEAHVP